MSDHKMQATSAPLPRLQGLQPRRPWLVIVFLMAGLLHFGLAMGQMEGTAYVPSHQPINEYLDAIDRIESDYGPYATELSDLYLGLGQTLMDRGDFEQARDAFNRGVLSVRVNSGPNSPEQTNHLYLLANIETLLGDMNAADEVLHNIHFINSEYYGEDSPEMLPVLDRMYQWYLVTRPPGADHLDYHDYQKTIEISEEMAQISDAAKGMGHSDTAVAYRRLAEAEFQMVRHLTGVGMTQPPDRYVAANSSSLFPLGLGAESVVKHYNSGRKAFMKSLESMMASKTATALEYAEALADLGDWLLIFEKPRRSREFYELGYQILAQSEATAKLADSYMSHPKPMHFFLYTQPIILEEIPADLEEMNLDISMSVTILGQVRNVEVLNAPEGISKDDIRAIKRRVLLIPFRPAMREGEIIHTQDFIWQYPVIAQEAAS